MLSMDSTSASPSASGPSYKQVFSTPPSPVLAHNKLAHSSNASHPRHMSDAAARPVGFGPRAEAGRDLTSEYQFADIITANTGQAMPKRVSMGNKKSAQSSSAMAHLVRGNDVSRIPLPGDRGRASNSGPTRLGSKSRSPHQNLALRSSSPAQPQSNLAGLSPAIRALLEETQAKDQKKAADMKNAYRRLSDANLVRSGGSLAEIGRRKKADGQTGGARLTKDYLSPDGDDVLEDSSDEHDDSSQEEGERGRKAARSYSFGALKPDADKKGGSKPRSASKAQSLLAAAEEERKSADSHSLLSSSQTPQHTAIHTLGLSGLETGFIHCPLVCSMPLLTGKRYVCTMFPSLLFDLTKDSLPCCLLIPGWPFNNTECFN